MSERMPTRMGYRATLDWLIDNDDLSAFIWRDNSPSPTVACCLAAYVFNKSTDRLRIDLLNRSGERHANKQRYGE